MINNISSYLKKYNSFAIVTHVNPDGDALGSSFALLRTLRFMGKKAECYFLTDIPDKYKFLASGIDYKTEMPSNFDFDCTVCVDCATADRLGIYKSFLDKAFSLNIDHHITNNKYADENLVIKAASCGEIIFDIIKAAGVPFTSDISNALYTAIFTDTGRFSYEDTKPQTFLKAAEIASCGLDIPLITNEVYASRSFGATKMIAKIIDNICLYGDGKIAFTHLFLSDMRDLGINASDCETAIDYAREIAGVEIAVFIREMDKNHYKVSLRSKKYANVAEIASVFGGGGHIRAAGCALNGEFYDVRDKVLKLCEEYI